jgi:gamma-glutamylcyclotransferase (GGCT)/AIG2-like uncharacterized protein YtfP
MKKNNLFFFYGTLQSIEVLKIVLNKKSIPTSDLSQAKLLNYDTVFVEGELYPTLVRSKGSTLLGSLYEVDNEYQIERLKYYEDEEEYKIQKVTVENKSGEKESNIFFPTSLIKASKKPWNFERWSSATNKEAFLDKVKNYMDQFNTESKPKW